MKIILSLFALIAIATFASLFPLTALAQTAESSAEKPRSAQTLYLNGFRSPSIGLEYRLGAVSLHSGYYTTVLSQSDAREKRSTNFIKTGVTHYFGGDARREFFASLSHVRGLSDGWKKDGTFVELGARWQVYSAVELRLGVGVLKVPGHSARLNPTPGISFAIPIR